MDKDKLCEEIWWWKNGKAIFGCFSILGEMRKKESLIERRGQRS